MRRHAAPAALLSLGLLAWTAIASAVPSAAISPPASSQATRQDAALSRLASCVRERRALAVLILMDESGSLHRSDPGDQRVRAAQVAIDGLGHLVDPDLTEPPVKVEIALASFARKFDVGAWRDLVIASDEIKREIAGFAARDDGDATDYVLALDRAREVLSEQAGAVTRGGGRAPCQALIWFTDGRYEPVGADSPPPVVDRGRHQLCDAGGVVDQLRASNAAVLTVALAGELNQPEEEFLRDITGRPGGSCGANASAGGGHYV
ncbi:MAG: vWA domain-containing protein, partial [Gammaproteobacteria bacterium]